MHARTAFGGGRISRNVVATFVALLLIVFLLGGASGYLVKGISLPVASRNQVSTPQTYALSDSSTRSHRGGPQTVDTQLPSGTTITTAPRHSGLQLP